MWKRKSKGLGRQEYWSGFILCNLYTNYIPWEKPRRHCISQGCSAYLKSCVAALLCTSGMTTGNVTTKMGSLISLRMIGSQSSRGQVTGVNPKCKGSRDIRVIRMLWPHRDLWQWLIDHDVPTNERDEQLNLYNTQMTKSGGQNQLESSQWKSHTFAQFPDLVNLQTHNLLTEEMMDRPVGLCTVTTSNTINLPPSLLRGTDSHLEQQYFSIIF